MDRPLILVSNDDGISAPGIRALIDVVCEIGDVVVVAPDGPQSGMGHAITLNSILRCDQIRIDEGPQIEYECSGTPVRLYQISCEYHFRTKTRFVCFRYKSRFKFFN